MQTEKYLLLGMVDAVEYRIKRGQEGRDKTRVESLRAVNPGVEVYSLDDKHSEVQIRLERLPNNSLREDRTPLPFHMQASFADPRRMFKTLEAKFEGIAPIKFLKVILDYFFSPVREEFFRFF